jgi:hypothetical protein
MTSKKQSTKKQPVVAVLPHIVLHVEHTVLVPVGEYRHTQTNMHYIVNDVVQPPKVYTQRGQQMSVQHNTVLRELRWLASEYADADITIQTDDPYLFTNMNNVIFNSPQMIVNGYRPELLAVLTEMKQLATVFNSFQLVQLDVPVEIMPRYMGTNAGFGPQAGPSPRPVAPQVTVLPQPQAQPAAVAKVDRRFSSGEASAAKPKRVRTAAGVKTEQSVVQPPTGPRPVDDQLDLFGEDEEQKAA